MHNYAYAWANGINLYAGNELEKTAFSCSVVGRVDVENGLIGMNSGYGNINESMVKCFDIFIARDKKLLLWQQAMVSYRYGQPWMRSIVILSIGDARSIVLLMDRTNYQNESGKSHSVAC